MTQETNPARGAGTGSAVREIQVAYQPKPKGGYVPNLRLAGEWLRRAGFEIGQRVTIQVLPDQIIIHR